MAAPRMRHGNPSLSRRAVMSALAGFGAAAMLSGWPRHAAAASILTRPIPTSGERIPALGMGTWITFDVGEHQAARRQRVEVLRTFFEMGGGMIDSSPMYGSSEAVVGQCLAELAPTPSLFAATKIWTLFKPFGPGQVRDSRRLWGLERFDLVQVHNLLNWQGHLETLREEKAAGRIRYLGVTTSHGRRHEELEKLMRNEPLDFVQFTYNIVDREAERRLLPLAAERGLAVIINRPFRRGQLFARFARQPLPAWAAELDCANWAQFFLKFIISHPAVTCAIPATGRPEHMAQNMGALTGRLPEPAMRERMARYVEML